MSIDPVIPLKRNYHKEFKSFMHHMFIKEAFTEEKKENNPNMLKKKILK